MVRHDPRGDRGVGGVRRGGALWADESARDLLSSFKEVVRIKMLDVTVKVESC